MMYSDPMYYLSLMNSTELLKGTLTTIIIKLLAENKKMYGYEIAQHVKTLSDNKILLKEGSLYPALHKLEQEGLVDVEKVFIGKRVRKYYSLTQKGTAQKKAQFDELLDFLQTIEKIVFSKPNVSPQ
ncbi:PadR family transcriptional regulator [Terrimonas sp. NA20]|uniref:PadR family transcriptional regulator n=1 Tax=Terrimonas ginsenosidimutans TaxID=2908004 RepID=A0ABS9KKT4_9BACT|nr:helix-turn-helix transcriptional regulator [Terrimonas ginsenosidimutans]MCG2612942.1 PadR family transcriptional regulator [Terrimonas ginsenosidimutans]